VLNVCIVHCCTITRMIQRNQKTNQKEQNSQYVDQCLHVVFFWIITFRVSRRGQETEMYIGHARLCVCLCLCVCSSPHAHTIYCTDTDKTWRNGTGYLLVVHCWANLQSVHGFRCYGNIVRTRNVSECLYSLYAWLIIGLIFSGNCYSQYVNQTLDQTLRA